MGSYSFIISFFNFSFSNSSSKKVDSVRLASLMAASLAGLIGGAPYSTIFHVTS